MKNGDSEGTKYPNISSIAAKIARFLQSKGWQAEALGDDIINILKAVNARDASQVDPYLDLMRNWDEALLNDITHTLATTGKTANIAVDIAQDADIFAKLIFFHKRWFNKFMLRMQILNNPQPAWVTSHPNFGKFIDESIPTFGTGNRPKDIKGLGTKFDQEFTNILKQCFDTNDFSKLPEYKYLYDKGYRAVSGQVTIKATSIKNSRPDNLLFVTKVEYGKRVIDYKDMIYVECKIRETSNWTDLQVEVLDKLEKNLVALTDLEFEVAFDTKDGLFLKGDKISIWEVHQASLDEINSVFVTKKIF